ncbi:hypothetical protein FB570_101134 [Streptomyces sp. T12]|nr:hypothetical protein FB570_101134 [Streptomyces sp. T12]
MATGGCSRGPAAWPLSCSGFRWTGTSYCGSRFRTSVTKSRADGGCAGLRDLVRSGRVRGEGEVGDLPVDGSLGAQCGHLLRQRAVPPPQHHDRVDRVAWRGRAVAVVVPAPGPPVGCRETGEAPLGGTRAVALPPGQLVDVRGQERGGDAGPVRGGPTEPGDLGTVQLADGRLRPLRRLILRHCRVEDAGQGEEDEDPESVTIPGSTISVKGPGPRRRRLFVPVLDVCVAGVGGSGCAVPSSVGSLCMVRSRPPPTRGSTPPLPRSLVTGRRGCSSAPRRGVTPAGRIGSGSDTDRARPGGSPGVRPVRAARWGTTGAQSDSGGGWYGVWTGGKGDAPQPAGPRDSRV